MSRHFVFPLDFFFLRSVLVKAVSVCLCSTCRPAVQICPLLKKTSVASQIEKSHNNDLCEIDKFINDRTGDLNLQ